MCCGTARSRQYSSFFDIDWELGESRIVLPILGSDDDVADLEIDGDLLRLGDLALPIAPGTGHGSGPEVHDRQHYRLIGWRNRVVGYRRFFSITSLAGLRQEHRTVFDASHAEVARWFAEGLVDGVRIDHPDGLSDPAGYLGWLRDMVGPDAWIVIEKILAVDEPLDLSLPIAGTTGYDALREIGGVFVDPHGAQALTALAASAEMPLSTADLKRLSATETLASELDRLRRAIVAAAGSDHPQLPDAVAALLTHVDVYRSDYVSLAAILPTALAATLSATPEFDVPLQLIAAAVAHGGEAAVRLQQLCGAVTAKAVEDCLFYRDARLVSLNEVGGETAGLRRRPGRIPFARRHSGPAVAPAMVTLSTHDTKRSEDVRARITVLAQVPSLWTEFIARWEVLTPSPDPATGLFLWQNIFGVWPVDGSVTAELRDRLHGYAEKAMREAAVHTTWNEPDADFEAAVHRWLDAIFDGPVARELTTLVQRLHSHAENDALGQKLLSLTSPGVPDIYQGTELWDDSLVDPDNRRAVDYDARRAALKSLQDSKIRVVRAALHLRRSRPDTFVSGGYHPVLARRFGRRSRARVPPRRGRARRGHPLDRAPRTERMGRYRADASDWLMARRADRSGVHRGRPGRGAVRRVAGRLAGAYRCVNSQSGHRHRPRSGSTSTASRDR